MSQCYRHLPGAAAGERTHHLVDLVSNGPAAAAAAAEAEEVGIASARFHTWRWHTQQEEEVLRVNIHHPSGGYKTSLFAEEEPVVVHRIRKLA